MAGIELMEPTDLYNILNQETVHPALSDPNHLLLLGKLGDNTGLRSSTLKLAAVINVSLGIKGFSQSSTLSLPLLPLEYKLD